MTAIRILEAQRFQLPKTARQFLASLAAAAVRARNSSWFSPKGENDWRTLDERLLLDIGKSPVDAETARLWARLGVATDADETQRAKRALMAVRDTAAGGATHHWQALEGEKMPSMRTMAP
jgi:hypothetical protein